MTGIHPDHKSALLPSWTPAPAPPAETRLHAKPAAKASASGVSFFPGKFRPSPGKAHRPSLGRLAAFPFAPRRRSEMNLGARFFPLRPTKTATSGDTCTYTQRRHVNEPAADKSRRIPRKKPKKARSPDRTGVGGSRRGKAPLSDGRGSLRTVIVIGALSRRRLRGRWLPQRLPAAPRDRLHQLQQFLPTALPKPSHQPVL